MAILSLFLKILGHFESLCSHKVGSYKEDTWQLISVIAISTTHIHTGTHTHSPQTHSRVEINSSYHLCRMHMSENAGCCWRELNFVTEHLFRGKTTLNQYKIVIIFPGLFDRTSVRSNARRCGVKNRLLWYRH